MPEKQKKNIFNILGPGFISGAADDDPTGVAAHMQSGAQFGYGMLWTALFTLPFMVAIQEMCGRIGLVTGKGLAGVIKQTYSKSLLYVIVVLLLVSNTINIGADLGVMAASMQLLVPIPFAFLLFGIASFILFLEVVISYRIYAQFLKYSAILLLSYAGVAFAVKQDWTQIFFATIIPNIELNKSFLLGLLAILGTNMSPYLFFWQANEEVEEEVASNKLRMMGRGTPKINMGDVNAMNTDTKIGMIFSNIIVFFIMIAAASTLGQSSIASIETPAQAALALKPIAGNFASLLFAIGIIGSGLLAVPVLAGSASYALSESLGWKEGLYRNFKQAHGFYGVIIAAMLIGLLVNFLPISPFRMLIYSAALNAIIAPPILVLILLISNNKNIMGRFTNSATSNVLGIFIITLMTAVAVGFFAFL
ncbi:MAG: Nramp family divalent metal transporter [Candidatus Spechtbacteria bacterium]|nr:Nramp family divalent metal transporter [Candidatus Spechtbacteria bacterium]